jgi:hypothetical protein
MHLHKHYFYKFLLSLFAITTATNLLAGGMDEGQSDDTAAAGPAFFGYVRDERGSILAKAIVSLQPKYGKAIVIQANVLGVYKSHVSPTAKADDVAIACEKPGYKQIRVVRRPATTAKVVETDCLMQKL